MEHEMAAIEFVDINPHEQECDHELDKLDLVGYSYRGNEVIVSFNCKCGRQVDEVFRFSHMRTS